jgi:putative transposase
MCRVLKVSRSGYYASAKRDAVSARMREDMELTERIRKIHERSRGTYGSPRVHAQLKRDGVHVSKERVERLMREAGIEGRVRRRYKATTDSSHRRPVAKNILNREFDAETPDSVWCADITAVPTSTGFVYLAAIVDVATRLVVGWAVDVNMETQLIVRALENALAWRAPAEHMIHHSDRGSQYASRAYQDVLAANGITTSMSRAGNCWDNALMESFFGTYKQEWAHHQRWRGLDDMRSSTHDYIEVFFNRERLHSGIGFLTPMEADRAAA